MVGYGEDSGSFCQVAEDGVRERKVEPTWVPWRLQLFGFRPRMD
jgi:hypothetical protein